MQVIVGLGNPGARYKHTRHNAGRMAAEAFIAAAGLPAPVRLARSRALSSEGVVRGKGVRVVLPETFMNESGSVVARSLRHTSPDALIVVHDDLDLPLGSIRLAAGRGSAGHKGVQSVAAAVGTQSFVRVRVGIAPVSLLGKVRKPKGGAAVAAFVIAPFAWHERAKIAAACSNAAQALLAVVESGVTRAMSVYNRRG